MRPGLDLVKMQREAAEHTKDKPSVQLNRRFEPVDFSAGYWSDLSNWPAWKAGTHLTPRYIGLVLNLICVTLVAAIVAALCEYRIRRQGRLLKYSLATLLIGVTLFAAGVAWIVQTQREFAAQVQLNDSLQSLYVHDELSELYLVYGARFPLVVSQLFNHGRHPWGNVPFFRKVKLGVIELDLYDEADPDVINRIVKLANANITQYKVHLNVWDFGPERQHMLRALDGTDIVSLDIDFDTRDWLEQELGENHTEIARARKLKNFKIDLNIDMPKLLELTLRLDRMTSQTEQLQQFMDIPSLELARIFGLSTEGAEFILESKTRWPREIIFEFQDDVPEELRQELKSNRAS